MTEGAVFPFPRIDSVEKLEELGVHVSFSWQNEQGRAYNVKEAPDVPGAIELEGFLPGIMSVHMVIEIAIEYPAIMFGKYAPVDAELAMALHTRMEALGEQCFQRLEGSEITAEVPSFVKRYVFKFPPKKFRERTCFSLLLYLKTPGHVGSKVFANNPGANLGVLDGRVVVTGGSGSLFPVFKIAEGKDCPLWRIESQITEDTLETDLDDVFKVYVNTDNPMYAMSGMEHSVFTPLLLEIFTSMCTTLISKVKEYQGTSWDLQGGDDTGATVVSRIRFFVKRCLPGVTETDLRVWTIDRLSNELRNNLYAELKDSINLEAK